MMVLKRFSKVKVINTNNPGIGFSKGRNYDQDLGRLGKMNTAQRELHRVHDLGEEIRKMNRELNRGGGIGRWQDID